MRRAQMHRRWTQRLARFWKAERNLLRLQDTASMLATSSMAPVALIAMPAAIPT
jgi:hypothetical protein